MEYAVNEELHTGDLHPAGSVFVGQVWYRIRLQVGPAVVQRALGKEAGSRRIAEHLQRCGDERRQQVIDRDDAPFQKCSLRLASRLT